MSLSVRDIAFYATALLAFPLVMTVTSVTASDQAPDQAPDRTTPLIHRGGSGQAPSATDR
jgi:hypothetical protein